MKCIFCVAYDINNRLLSAPYLRFHSNVFFFKYPLLYDTIHTYVNILYAVRLALPVFRIFLKISRRSSVGTGRRTESKKIKTFLRVLRATFRVSSLSRSSSSGRKSLFTNNNINVHTYTHIRYNDPSRFRRRETVSKRTQYNIQVICVVIRYTRAQDLRSHTHTRALALRYVYTDRLNFFFPRFCPAAPHRTWRRRNRRISMTDNESGRIHLQRINIIK